jgi:hypothetical protein
MSKPFNATDTLQFAKSLGLGSCLGACVGVIAKHYWKASPMTEGQAMYCGAIIGASICRIIEWAFRKIMCPLTCASSYYLKLLQLSLLEGTISKTQKKKITEQLNEQYFLGKCC